LIFVCYNCQTCQIAIFFVISAFIYPIENAADFLIHLSPSRDFPESWMPGGRIGKNAVFGCAA
jgi:hypothetical protein